MNEGMETTRPISEGLLEILVCPLDKEKVELVGNSLMCTVCGREYPIENGIPNMLTEDDS
jgi:uncharacterized protein YbaR (Trm112 family)